jgi:hypothetical protein
LMEVSVMVVSGTDVQRRVANRRYR